MLQGVTGKDAELRHINGGTAVANFSMATSERSKKQNGEYEEKTQWHNIVAWRATAEFVANHVPKGSKITVIGKLEYSQYQNKEGQTVYRTDIVATSVDLIVKGGQSNNNNGSGNNGGYQSQQQEAPAFYTSDADNDLPF